MSGGPWRWLARALLAAGAAGCAPERPATETVLTFPGSAVGAEGEVLERQLGRFAAENPDVRVVRIATPDSADERHQLFVQWLNAGAGDPDVLQLDVAWVPEFAAAGWILPLDRYAPEVADVFPNVLAADRYQGALHAVPWFVDVGLLYWRTDLTARAPTDLEQLAAAALAARATGAVPYGLVLQGARYEGLVTVFQELLGAFGGRLVDAAGTVVVDEPAAARALTWLRDAVHDRGIVPEAALAWREEPSRFAFQNGQAAFLRNWPYCWRLLGGPDSRVAGRFAAAPMPATADGRPTAALGGQQLAINVHAEHPDAAWRLVEFLTAPERMVERARVTGQLPPRRSLYVDGSLAGLDVVPPAVALAAIEHAVSRPVTPLWSELSQALQVHLHRALTLQEAPAEALAAAAATMRARQQEAAARATGGGAAGARTLVFGVLLAGLGGLLLLAWRRVVRAAQDDPEVRTATLFLLPAVVAIAAVAVFPLLWTVTESLHGRDLRTPAAGTPFVGFAHYAELFGSPRFRDALLHTAFFTVTTVLLEVVLGLGLALALDRSFRGRGLARALTLLPWAIPTVVAALVWRFLFEGEHGPVNAILQASGVSDAPIGWFTRAWTAWWPVILADVWKTTPFVTLLLLAGLARIDADLLDAARVDGARPFRRFLHVTLPLLAPALLVVLLFRTLDAFRVFEVVYVVTGGGPGTATEPVSLFAFDLLLNRLRFGAGAAAAVVTFGATLVLALVWLRLLGREPARGRS